MSLKIYSEYFKEVIGQDYDYWGVVQSVMDNLSASTRIDFHTVNIEVVDILFYDYSRNICDTVGTYYIHTPNQNVEYTCHVNHIYYNALVFELGLTRNEIEKCLETISGLVTKVYHDHNLLIGIDFGIDNLT